MRNGLTDSLESNRDPKSGVRIANLVLTRNGLRVRSFTPGISPIYSLTKADLGRPISEIPHLAVEMPDFSALSPGGDGVEPDCEVETVSGRWFLRSLDSNVSENESDSSIVVSFCEITDRKRVEMRLGTAYAVTSLLADADSFYSAAPGILDAIRSSLQAEVCLLWLVNERTNLLNCVAESLSDPSYQKFASVSIEGHFAKGEGLPGEVWKRRAPIWFEEIQHKQGFVRSKLAARFKLKSGVATPIIVGKKFRGLIEVFTIRHLSREPELLAMLGAVGSDIGQFIRRNQLDEKLREQEARKTAILDAAMDSVITMDIEGKIVDFSTAAEATFGFRRKEVIGQPLAQLIIPENLRDAHHKGFSRFLKFGESNILGKRVEIMAQRADGSQFPIELAVNVSQGLDGVPFFTGYVRDITNRKQADAVLEQRAKLATLHSNLAVTLAGESTLDEILDSCCRKVVDQLDFTKAAIWVKTEKGAKLERAARAVRLVSEFGSQSPRFGDSIISRIAVNRETKMTDNIGNGLSFDDIDWEPKDDLVVFAGFPLIVENRVIGVFALHAAEKLPRDIFELMMPMADAIAQCIARKVSDERIRENEQRLLQNQNQLIDVLQESEETKAKLRVLFDQSLYYAGILDLDGTLLDINQTALVTMSWFCSYLPQNPHNVVNVKYPFLQDRLWIAAANATSLLVNDVFSQLNLCIISVRN